MLEANADADASVGGYPRVLAASTTMADAAALYERFIKKSTKLHVHDEENSAGEGDTVRVVSTRPLSKLKRWRLEEIIERAK